jgi:tetratricopeptide (TPR) repeat protein
VLEKLLAQFGPGELIQLASVPPEIATAFRDIWKTLEKSTQQVGRMLGLFATVPISQELLLTVMQDAAGGSWDASSLTAVCEELIQHHLLECSDEDHYVLHCMIHFCLRQYLSEVYRSDHLKRSFCRVMAATAREIPESPSQSLLTAIPLQIPHLTEAATTWVDWLADEDLVALFAGLGRFYKLQGDYEQALPWYQDGLILARDRLGQKHPDVAQSLNNLAGLYCAQGQYEMSELLCKQALEMRKHLLGQEHPDVAQSLNSLALLYYTQEQYSLAEPLYEQALEMRLRLLGEEHPDVALSFNNLAGLYYVQGRLTLAERLSIKALELRRKLLGEHHSAVALSLNNLAMIYEAQQHDEVAASFYHQAFTIAEQVLGVDHANTLLYRMNWNRANEKARSPLRRLSRWWRSHTSKKDGID